MSDKIKVITPPDVLFDQAISIAVVCPDIDLKNRLQEFLLNSKESYNIYLFTEDDIDIKWLLTTAKMADYVLINVDGVPSIVGHFLSYLLSLPTTYYKSAHNVVQWNLLNQNRFYDFPNFESEIE